MPKSMPIIIIIIVCACAWLIPTVSPAAVKTRPFNRIAIVLDGSGSYKELRMQAVDKAIALMEQVAARKSKRWEGKDQILIISLDSSPELIWQGTKDELTEDAKKDLLARFAARQDYEACTDVEGGLQLAVQELNREPAAEYKYLFAFSDLIHEPPVDGSNKCAPPNHPSVPGKEFTWDSFADISTSVFWMPVAQKMAWKKGATAAGVADSFHLYTQSESAAVKIASPKKAKHVATEEEKLAGREKVGGFFGGIVKIAASVLLIVLSLLLVGGAVTFGVTWYRRNNRNRR